MLRIEVGALNPSNIDKGCRVIGFVGLKGHGKSKAGQSLEKFGFVRGSPAHTIRRMLRPFLLDIGIPEEELDEWLEGQYKRTIIPCLGVSPTTLQQTLGTEWGRNLLGLDLWLQVLALRMQGKSYYNDSVRFHNEAAYIFDAGGMLIRVIRSSKLDGKTDSHASETEQLDIKTHYTVYNDSSIEELQHTIQTIVHSHGIIEVASDA